MYLNNKLHYLNRLAVEFANGDNKQR